MADETQQQAGEQAQDAQTGETPASEQPITFETVYKALMDEGYIVRWLPGQGLADGLRITIGSEAENIGVIAALRKILEQHS